MLTKVRTSPSLPVVSIWSRITRFCTALAASGASPSSEICSGAWITDSTYWPSMACAAAVGCTPSANR